ncbi:protein of unknown function [Nitrospira defluvii]|uniref:Uncharacterized protein n=1 Tax=Nitrospira defluvii TaxID=330214 RepID=D8P8F3_9BACT|nr:protein of unknown function [Nitrospira defluvii]
MNLSDSYRRVLCRTDSVAMPLKGAYFNGGLKTSQFRYDCQDLRANTLPWPHSKQRGFPRPSSLLPHTVFC